MRAVYFRYVSAAERDYICAENCVLSFSGVTFLSPDRYESGEEAARALSLPDQPVWRVGAIGEDWLPDIVVPRRRVIPAFGQPGGGWEVAVRGPIYLFGFTLLK